MTKISNLGVVETLDGLNKKEFSSLELINEYLQLIDSDKELNAFIHFNEEKSLSLAKLSDERRSKNEALPLDGLPIAVKDIFCVNGERTSACSKILENFIPNYESTVYLKIIRGLRTKLEEILSFDSIIKLLFILKLPNS